MLSLWHFSDLARCPVPPPLSSVSGPSTDLARTEMLQFPAAQRPLLRMDGTRVCAAHEGHSIPGLLEPGSHGPSRPLRHARVSTSASRDFNKKIQIRADNLDSCSWFGRGIQKDTPDQWSHVPLLESTALLPAHDGSVSACAQDVHREYAPPESASECAPTVHPRAESFRICRRSTAVANFELGRSRNGICRAGGAAAVAGVGEPSVDGFVAGYAAYRFTHGVTRRAVSVGV